MKNMITRIKNKESKVLDHNDIDFKTAIDVAKTQFFLKFKI